MTSLILYVIGLNLVNTCDECVWTFQFFYSLTMCVDETRVINKIMYTVIYVIFAFNLFIY